jgi:[protein-PII] uridylyltransferase
MQPICEDYFKDVEGPAGSSSMHLNPHVRAYLDDVRAYLLDLHDRGVSARGVNEEHADLMDRLVRKLFRLAEDRYFDESPRLNFRLAVAAVGGYGRREMSFGSDVDLLFLHRGKLNPYVETIAEALTQRLWDARLVVGGATRTIRESLRLGARDLSTLTSYLDSRFLIGDPELYAEFENAVQDHMRRHRARFVEQKLEERAGRHERFHESLYLLQPNLRESVGGLRDYHTALWVARAAQWDVRRPEDLAIHGFIDASDAEALLEALDFLWRARNELHRAGRKDDQLHYEAQERLVAHLGLRDEGDTLAVEKLMRSYYRYAGSIDYLSRQAIGHAQSLLGGRARGDAPYAVEEGFAIADARLEIPSAEILTERPVRVLAAFAVAQHHDVEISARAQRLLRQHVQLIDDEVRADSEAADLFKRILRSPTRVYRTLQVMNELGVLGAYLPEFGSVVGLWNQDMYHTYTVDVHSLFLVEQLRRLRKGRFAEELGLATELMREVRDPLLLFLAALFHDIGKGRGGGHSEKGAQLVPPICARMGLDEAATAQIQFLVRHHLTMSAMAEQRDVHDPRQIMRLVSLVQSREQLRSLYLLTVADIRSVSPEAWTRWKAGLLEAFYRNAADWLEAGAEEGAGERLFLERALHRFEESERDSVALLAEQGADTQRAIEFLEQMPRRYLLNHTPSEIAEHVRAAFEFADSERRVAVRAFVDPSDAQSFWGVVVITRDRPGLFSTVTGVLTALGHDILAAQVYTSKNRLAVEIYVMAPIAGGDEEAEFETDRIEMRLDEILEGRRELGPVDLGGAAHPTVRTQPPRVQVLNGESDLFSVIEVVTNDRRALLFDITRALAELDLDVGQSRAATRAQRATDAFYVTDHGHKLTDPERCKLVEETLLRAIRQEDR